MTLVRELKAPNSMNDSRSWMRRMTLVRELRALNAMNEFVSLMI